MYNSSDIALYYEDTLTEWRKNCKTALKKGSNTNTLGCKEETSVMKNQVPDAEDDV
jgi:hypothetical protein